MNKLLMVAVFFTSLVPFSVVWAQQPTVDPVGGIGSLFSNFIQFSNNVLIPFILGIGFLYFVWGMFQYFILGAADEGAQERGTKVFLYSIAGFVIIFIFWGVVTMLARSTGLALPTIDPALIPAGPVPQLYKDN